MSPRLRPALANFLERAKRQLPPRLVGFGGGPRRQLVGERDGVHARHQTRHEKSEFGIPFTTGAVEFRRPPPRVGRAAGGDQVVQMRDLSECIARFSRQHLIHLRHRLRKVASLAQNVRPANAHVRVVSVPRQPAFVDLERARRTSKLIQPLRAQQYTTAIFRMSSGQTLNLGERVGQLTLPSQRLGANMEGGQIGGLRDKHGIQLAGDRAKIPTIKRGASGRHPVR